MKCDLPHRLSAVQDAYGVTATASLNHPSTEAPAFLARMSPLLPVRTHRENTLLLSLR